MIINPSIKKESDLVSKKKEKTEKSEKSKSIFSGILKTSIEKTDNDIEDLMDSLKDQEKKFLDLQTLIELNNYKKAIKKILDMIIKGGFQNDVYKNRKKNKEYLIIREIDQKLLELTKLVTSPQNKAFSLFKEIEEIRGLIFDLIY